MTDLDAPPWLVTLVCGASGVGKSRTAVPLAARFGAPLAEADDIVTALTALTTAEQQPLLHPAAANPEMRDWPVERIADLHLALAEALRPAFRAVIADHLDFAAPVVLEGDYLLPELAAEFGDAVRAVVIDEQRERILANHLAREPAAGPQHRRAELSALLAGRFAERARGCGVPVVAARPWPDTVERAERALRAAG